MKTRTEGCILLHLRRCLEKDILLRRQPLPISVPFSGLSPTQYIFSKLRKVPISFLRQLSKEDTEIEGYSDSVTPFRICNKSGKSVAIPTHVKEFLGVKRDSKTKTVS